MVFHVIRSAVVAVAVTVSSACAFADADLLLSQDCRDSYRHKATGVGTFCGEAARGGRLRAWVDAAWERVMRTYYLPGTGCIYSTTPDKVNRAADFTDGFLRDEFDHGTGIEDCAIVGGVALSGLVDRHWVTRDPAAARDAVRIARGLLNLESRHPYRGFVARGICPEDGKSILRFSSRDQVTHWYHGLWRYWASGMATDETKAAIKTAFASVAGLMERNVTEKNGWNFLQADGTPDRRGICKMRHVMPHEAARLAAIYCVTAAVTGEAKWGRLYEEVRREALDGSLDIARQPQRVTDGMPAYGFIQMNTSLEMLLALAPSADDRLQVLNAMVCCARIARERVCRGDGVRDSRYLCAAGELPLTQLMTPATSFAWDARQQATLAEAILHTPADRVGSTRACHLTAAFWRARRLGYFPGE